jgi:hypothetical protein
MKLILLAIIATFATPGLVVGQNAKPNGALETKIRRLDHAEAEGLLHKDVAALEQLWAEDFTVNNPRNGITNGRKEVVALIRNGTIDYASFVREIETMLFHGDAVIVMGLETIPTSRQGSLRGPNRTPPLHAVLDEETRSMASDGTSRKRDLPKLSAVVKRLVLRCP